MPHYLVLLAVIATTAPVAAETAPPYYGPGKHWLGIGYKFGYTDKVEKDGSWRIEARVRHGEAVNVAMYRAAEKAREGGFRYIQFLRVSEQYISYGYGFRRSASLGMPIGFATVWARPAAAPGAPSDCQPLLKGEKTVVGCYTADAAEVTRVLGGPSGKEPGMALIDHVDDHGRTVLRSGFGTGMVDSQGHVAGYMPVGRAEANSRFPTLGSMVARVVGASPVGSVKPAPVTPVAVAVPAPALSAASGINATETQARFNAAMRAQQPVRGRDARQGWTISD